MLKIIVIQLATANSHTREEGSWPSRENSFTVQQQKAVSAATTSTQTVGDGFTATPPQTRITDGSGPVMKEGTSTMWWMWTAQTEQRCSCTGEK